MAEYAIAPSRLSPPAAVIDDCWRRIGVSGDRSCPLLATHVHCRNCPTYAQAAVALLDGLAAAKPVDPSELESAAPDPAHAAGEAGQSCLVFRVGDEWLALPTAALGEVTALSPVHSLPHRRHAALTGVAAVRGTLLACVSLALLFGGDGAGHATPADIAADGGDGGDVRAAASRGARFLILGQGRGAIALPVAEVAGVRRLPKAALLPLPATLARASMRYTLALFEHDGHSVGLLDATLLRQAVSRSLA